LIRILIVFCDQVFNAILKALGVPLLPRIEAECDCVLESSPQPVDCG